MRIKTLSICICLLWSFSAVYADDQITQLPGATTIVGKEYAGYLTASNHQKLFYWLVENPNPAAPLIVWMNGGPGYSSLFGFFNETGPYKIQKNLTLVPKKHGWNTFANYLVIEQPGVGFSSGMPANREEAVQTYYEGLMAFLKHYPAYTHTPLYLSGESYAGTFIPLVSQRILKAHSANLKGLILISPWVDPKLQISRDVSYALTHGLITKSQAKHIQKIYAHCALLLDQKEYDAANEGCNKVGEEITKFSQVSLTNINYVREMDNALLDGYLNQSTVRSALHVDQTTAFHAFSAKANDAYKKDIFRSAKPLYDYLLAQKIRILIITGLSDGKDTNFMGVHHLLKSFQWENRSAFMQAQKTLLFDEGVILGYAQSGGGLSWVLVRNAGHMVPYDQPSVSGIVKPFVAKGGR